MSNFAKKLFAVIFKQSYKNSYTNLSKLNIDKITKKSVKPLLKPYNYS